MPPFLHGEVRTPTVQGNLRYMLQSNRLEAATGLIEVPPAPAVLLTFQRAAQTPLPAGDLTYYRHTLTRTLPRLTDVGASSSSIVHPPNTFISCVPTADCLVSPQRNCQSPFLGILLIYLLRLRHRLSRRTPIPATVISLRASRLDYAE